MGLTLSSEALLEVKLPCQGAELAEDRAEDASWRCHAGPWMFPPGCSPGSVPNKYSVML